VDLIRRWFAGSYLRAYLRLRRLDRVDVPAWYPVVLAARLGEGIEAERGRIVEQIREALEG
jgi:hypothetical protein